MNITRVEVLLTQYGSDRIVMDTDLPSAVWPYQGSTALFMEAARDTGVEYVRKHLGFEPRITNLRYEEFPQ